MRSAFLHLMGDVLSTVGAVVAGVLIYFTGANWLDPLVSILIGLLILWNARGILRDAVNILLEATPHDVDMSAMISDIQKVEGVLGVHDLHVWSITQNMRTMSAHILTEDIPISTGALIQTRINELLARRYNIAHATLQLECACRAPNLLYCEMCETGHVHEQITT
jgi:cobalt-zinc-cadmium efflux system protein